ncbi:MULTISPECIES: hypothetical protein [unclassified Streptomyces]
MDRRRSTAVTGTRHALPVNENAFWQLIDDCAPPTSDPEPNNWLRH